METLLKEELEARRYFTVQVEREDDDDLFEWVISDVYQFLRIFVDRLALR